MHSSSNQSRRMSSPGLSFWVNLLSVIATTYILTWYTLTPSTNQCQMTFMMEPPKFIPINIEKDSQSSHQDQQGIVEDDLKPKTDYQLYMYSEFGFPMASNVNHDLKDSMPVLFVPGNAGSYQQVRSLASTCIRQQLQSIEAFKFVFYTIDFKGQFSGISGDLLDRQMLFVHKSLEQISKMHPTDTGGTILIGHSVGGFISKYLFTRHDFDPSSVPLLISLASPLTKPYLVFDKRMGEIYKTTTEFWSKWNSDTRYTVSISISGGESDRLVPINLSLDPTFDLSMTTVSMRDVFMTTDHVCITWCRELMQKLANLLSILMDKRRTRLIDSKRLKLSLIKRELLLTRKPNYDATFQRSDQHIRGPYEILSRMDSQLIHRNQLKDKTIISGKIDPNSLILIDHIDPFKDSAIFGCKSLVIGDNGQVLCQKRLNLAPLALPIPTSRFEPRRSVIKITSELAGSIDFIGLDFASYLQRAGPPESISIQKLSDKLNGNLEVPDLFEAILRKITFSPIRKKLHSNNSSTTEFYQLSLVGLKASNQALFMSISSIRCVRDEPNIASILLYQDGSLEANAYISSVAKTNPNRKARVGIHLRKSLIGNIELDENKSYVELYLDGTCENTLEIELDFLELIAQLLQGHLGTILSCATFLAIRCIVVRTENIRRSNGDQINAWTHIHELGLCSLGSIIIAMISQNFKQDTHLNPNIYFSIDYLCIMISIMTLASGLFSFLSYFTRRLVDLALIVNRSLMRLKGRFKQLDERQSDHSNNTTRANKITKTNIDNTRTRRSIIEWSIICLSIASSVILSTELSKILELFILTKSSIDLSSSGKPIPNPNEKKKYSSTNQNIANNLKRNDLILSLIVISSIVAIINIPDALLKLSDRNEALDLSAVSLNMNTSNIVISLTLILTKLICDRAEMKTTASSKREDNSDKRSTALNIMGFASGEFIGTLAIVPTVLIETNIHYIEITQLILSLWILIRLSFD